MATNAEELPDVRRLLENAGWGLEIPPQESCLDVLAANEYAVVGIVLDLKGQRLRQVWDAAEQFLADRGDSAGKPWRDLYLVVVLDDLRPEQDVVHQMCDNTRVCRKVCLRRNGTAAEVLAGVPFIQLRLGETPAEEAPGDRAAQGIPDGLLSDLATRSAQLILERYLGGSYSLQERGDET